MGFSLLFQVATRFKSRFFTAKTGEELWKSATSISSAARRKGIRPKRARNLNRQQYLGKGEVNTIWPGLNAPIGQKQRQPTPHRPMIVPADKEAEAKRMELRDRMARQTGLRRVKIKLHPFERGYSGIKMVGRRLGPPPPIGDEHFEGFQSICGVIKVISHGTSRGFEKTWSAIVITGNGNGLAGFSNGKSSNARKAMEKALKRAGNRCTYIERLHGTTIFQDFYAECFRAQMYVRRMPTGYGIQAHRLIRDICNLIGLTDIHVRMDGSKTNYLAITKAFFAGLWSQETHQELAERKRLHVVEFGHEDDYMPRVVASPRLNPTRTEAEVEGDEILDVEELYGMGRTPFMKPIPKPFFFGYDSFIFARWREYPFRNFEDVAVRMIAEGHVKRWTHPDRHAWGEREHQKVIRGERPLPMGIGLPKVDRNSLEDEEEVE